MFGAVRQIQTEHSPEALVEQLHGERGIVLLRSGLFDSAQGRYSFVAARPFLTFTSFASRCEVRSGDEVRNHFGNPWQVLEALLARYELLDEVDVPFPLGGCFGYWGYELKDALESRLTRRAVNDLELPDCHLGFHDSLVVFDHALGRTFVISTGLQADGSRSAEQARGQFDWWDEKLRQSSAGACHGEAEVRSQVVPASSATRGRDRLEACATLNRKQFIARVGRAKEYIRSGDIYQVNLSRRISAETELAPWGFFQRLQTVSPAPFAAYLDCGEFQIASSSPESFLRMSGRHIRTRPIKGTRPRSSDPTEDTRLAYELQTSTKEQAELVMITDLLRNDLGRVCEFGSVQVPELFRLERYAHVQHLVSTVEGHLRADLTHLAALAACFPGGSITGTPKIRAMQIIDELEPVTRGPYTGALGYLGFNRESQLSIVIRTAVCARGQVHFHVGAGIVADSVPEAEFEETQAKAGGFFAALEIDGQSKDVRVPSTRLP